MKQTIFLLNILGVFALLISACAGQASTPKNQSVEDSASLVSALQTAGAKIEVGESVEQVFFTVTGQIIKVNDTDVQVFEYETAEAMESDAAQVAPDGGSIGTSMVAWVATPHFYKAGRILVLYIGDDQTVLELLEGALGPQFAGR